MLDVGVFEPTAAIGPSRTASGTTLGRLTTTEEQKREAIERLTLVAAERGVDELRATIAWSRGEPTILSLTFDVEHIDGKEVYLPDRVTELTTGGGEIEANEEARLRRLNAEVLDLHESGML